MPTLPEIRPSRPLSVRLPQVVIDALAQQLPRDYPSVNAWVSEAIHALIDFDKLSKADRHEWLCTSRPLPRAGRK